MSGAVENMVGSFKTAGGVALEPYRIVKLDGAEVEYAGAGEGEEAIGFTQANMGSFDPHITPVRFRNAGGTVKIQMATDIQAGDPIFAAADGRGSKTSVGDAVAVALKDASGAGSIIEALPIMGGTVIAGAVDELVFLGTLSFGTADNGDLRSGITLPYDCEVLEVFSMTKQVLVGSAGAINVTLELDSTPLTGGVLAMSTANHDALGKRVDASAITGAADYTAGDDIDVVGSGAAGTRTSGEVELYAVVRRK